MRKWALLLHFHQPPTQHPVLVEHILTTSYLPVLDVLLRNPRAKASLNLGDSLLKQLRATDRANLFGSVSKLVERGQVELTLSPASHPLAPITPRPALAALLEEHRRTLSELFPKARPRFVYPPELAVDAGCLKTFSAFSDGCAVDESSVDPEWSDAAIGPVFYEHRGYRLLASSRYLTDLLRAYPRAIDPGKFLGHLKASTSEGQILFTACDAEIFGHHYEERIRFLESLLRASDVSFMKIGELIAAERRPPRPVGSFVPSTWETSREEAAEGNPWPLWLDPANPLQRLYARLADLAYEALRSAAKGGGSGSPMEFAEDHYHAGLSSCYPYWLSNKPWWHPDLSQDGATHLIRCVRTLPVRKGLKIEAEDAYHALLRKMWRYNWSRKPERGYAAHDRRRASRLARMPDLG
jgi:hypothetical protein